MLRASATSGSNKITSLGEHRYTLRLPVEAGFAAADPACTVLFAAEDGTVTTLTGKYVQDESFSYISVSLSGFGTVIALPSGTAAES